MWRKVELIGDYEDFTLPVIFSPAKKMPHYDEEKDKYLYEVKKELCVPDMDELKQIALDERSGLMFITIKE